MRRALTSFIASSSLLLAAALAGCASALPATEDLPFTKVEPGKEDSSAEAVFIDLTFEGELETTSRHRPEQQIEDQLLYTIGQMNGLRGVSRLDRLTVRDVSVESLAGNRYRVRYGATLPVAFGRRASLPTEITLRLPRDMSAAGLTAFTERYSHTCVDVGAHDVTSGSYWYYYRPARSGCRFDAADIVEPIAGVTPSESETTGRFPEYDMVWADDALRVVAIFGKYEDGATTSSDAGISAYNRFLRETASLLRPHALVTEPATVARDPGTSVPEVTFRATLAGGRTIEIVAILVDNVRTAGAAFDARYAQLSTRADLIVYNGHAGLGANIRALASKGRWVAGQYVIVFMNGCDTYAYVDDALFAAHARVNPGDPEGTRHTDVVMNAMPAYFSSMPRATLAMVRGLMSFEAPRTYEQIFADIDSSQIVVVSGEHDNVFTPGGAPGGGEPVPTWGGLRESGTLARNAVASFETPVLSAGRYRFAMTGTGDADLHVRIGGAASRQVYDCRPYKSNAIETCEVTLPSDATIGVLVHGYSASTFELVGQRL